MLNSVYESNILTPPKSFSVTVLPVEKRTPISKFQKP